MAEMGRAHSQTPIPPLVYNRSSQIKEDNSKRKLEDYLDPVLLHTISSRIGLTQTKEKLMEKKDVVVNTNQRMEFDWPVDRLYPLINDPNRNTACRSWEEDDGARFFAPTIPSLSKRRRNDFPIWKVNDNKHGAS